MFSFYSSFFSYQEREQDAGKAPTKIVLQALDFKGKQNAAARKFKTAFSITVKLLH